ncbi:MAG TPA: hypothetical protein VFI31_07895 [Pirellulales bacterium]|nr:hypothetical protein [Pirellulales bacterium]
MSDNEKSGHWNSLIDELGVEAAPRPPKPAVVVPPPPAKKRPAAPPVENRPKGNWDEVAATLGVDVPPRPPKPTPTAVPKPPKPSPPAVSAPVTEATEVGSEATSRPPQREGNSRDGGRRDGGREREGSRRRGRRDGGRGERSQGERSQGERGRHERRGDRSTERTERQRFDGPPAEELLADEMVSADFVDELVLAEDEGDWTDELASETPASRPADADARGGRRRRRRRGGRRGRESADRPTHGEARDYGDETREEREHIDEIVDAIEASPIAEPDEREPLEEAVAAQDLDDKRRRRRRRRRGGRRDAEGESSRRESRGMPDTELDDPDELPMSEQEPTPYGESDADGESSDGDYDEHDDEHDEHDLRPSHRAIPSWEEAIGVIVSGNMESRAKHPQSGGGGRGRGRGGRGQGRRS